MLDLTETTTHSPVLFTVTARADASLYGYEGGRDYTFTFATGSSMELSPDAFQRGDYLPDAPSLNSVASAGIIGSYSRGERESWVVEGSRTSAPMGGARADALITPSAELVRNITLYLPSVLQLPEQELTDLTACYGTYTPGPGAHLSLLPQDEQILNFTAISVTITSGVIPEPGTTPLVLNAAALTLGGRRSCVWLN